MNEQLLHIGFAGTLLTPLICVLLLGIMALLKRPLNEREVSFIARGMVFIYLSFTTLLFVTWMLLGLRPVKWDVGSVYHLADSTIQCALFLDRASMVFLSVTAVIANIIILFSRRYLHRDPGFRRFYLVLSMFLFGMTLLFCAGSFDLIFAAWEIIGLSSFLLIGFYWHRPAAVINAKKAYFIYRICDVGLLAATLLTHLIWHDPDLFFDLTVHNLVGSWAAVPLWQQWVLSVLILLPVIGKSAQFPLSYWLPKAMEGPTPSSAIFYGSISIHAGVFLLIRTSLIWQNTPGFVWLLVSVGVLTAVFATIFGRVQSNIKGQIGYASIAQVGIMLVELAFGFEGIVLIHFIGNAFLRCFQLLVSSSIIAEQLQIHSALEGKQLQHRWSIENWIPTHLRHSLYVFAINEGYLEPLLERVIAKPFARVAKLAHSASTRWNTTQNLAPASATLKSTLWFPVFVLALYGVNFTFGPSSYVPLSFLIAAVFLSLGAFAEDDNPVRSLKTVCFSHLCLVSGLFLNHAHAHGAATLYAVGFFASWFLAHDGYAHVFSKRMIRNGRQFNGLFAQFPLASAVCFLGVLGLIGFPIATTFYAEDILFEHALEMGIVFIGAMGLIFVVNGITLFRMFSRCFFGSRDAEGSDLSLDISRLRAFALVGFFLVANGLGFVLI